MMFVWIAVVFGLLELWALGIGGHTEPALPALVRVGGPIALGAMAVRYPSSERWGLILSSAIVFVFLNPAIFASQIIQSSLMGVLCVVLAVLGYSMRNEAARARPQLLVIAAVAAIGAYLVVVQLLVGF